MFGSNGAYCYSVKDIIYVTFHTPPPPPGLMFLHSRDNYHVVCCQVSTENNKVGYNINVKQVN